MYWLIVANCDLVRIWTCLYLTIFTKVVIVTIVYYFIITSEIAHSLTRSFLVREVVLGRLLFMHLKRLYKIILIT